MLRLLDPRQRLPRQRLQMSQPRLPGKLVRAQQAALDAIQEMASSEEFCFSMWLEPGDLQLVNNHVAIHSRTHYEDFEEPERKRHLLRLWLAVPQGRPLCAGLAGGRQVRVGVVRGTLHRLARAPAV